MSLGISESGLTGPPTIHGPRSTFPERYDVLLCPVCDELIRTHASTWIDCTKCGSVFHFIDEEAANVTG